MTRPSHNISPQTIQYYLDEGARLRHQAISQAVAQLFGRRRTRRGAAAK